MSIVGDYVIPTGFAPSTSEGLILPPATPEIRRRQLEIGADISVSSVEWALKKLGSLDVDTTAFLVATEGCRDPAAAAAREFRLVLIVLPDEMCVNYSWAVMSAKGTIFSVPKF